MDKGISDMFPDFQKLIIYYRKKVKNKRCIHKTQN